MPDTEIEQRLRDAGAVFIDAHDKAADAIREARSAGMSAEAISQVGGLSAETVAAFLPCRVAVRPRPASHGQRGSSSCAAAALREAR